MTTTVERLRSAAAPVSNPPAASMQRASPAPQSPQFKVLQSRGEPAQRALFVGPPGAR